MKTLISFFVLLFVNVSFTYSISIFDALSSKKIEVKTDFQSLDEKGMDLTIKNLQNSRITVVIPAGTEFTPDNDEEQPLLNIEEEIFVLKPYETRLISVGAYCLDYNKNAPSYSTDFAIAPTQRKLVKNFLSFIKNKDVSKENYQATLWVLENYDDIANIDPINEADNQLREFVAQETNRTNPWYSNETDIVAEPGTPIERNSVSISGELNFKPEKDFYLEMVVISLADNTEIREMGDGSTRIPKDWETTFGFSLEVQGWEKGEYEVVIRDSRSKESIKKFPFNV